MLPFEIPELGWRFVDRRALEPVDEARASYRWLVEAVRLMRMNASLSVDMLCDFGGRWFRRALVLYAEAVEAGETMPLEDWIDAGGGVELETDQDLRLSQLFLCVREGPRWIGGIAVSNIHLERIAPGRFQGQAFFVPGVPAAGPRELADVWSTMIGYLLDNDLEMAGGRTLDLTQYNFHSSPVARSTMQADPMLRRFIGLMNGRYERRGDPDNLTAPVRWRRPGAPEPDGSGE